MGHALHQHAGVQAPLKISYDLTITLVSLLIVLITALGAMKALTIPELTLKRCLISSMIMGIGISTMHYLGMSAMRSAATQHYEPRMFALSIVVAVLSSIALLTLSRHLRQYAGMFHQMFRYGVSLLLGAGLLTMHLMGMRALRLVIPENAELHIPGTENSQQLGLTIAAITLLITPGASARQWPTRSCKARNMTCNGSTPCSASWIRHAFRSSKWRITTR